MGGAAPPELRSRQQCESITQVIKKGQIRGADRSDGRSEPPQNRRLSPTAARCQNLGSSWETMVAKNRKQTGKSPATQSDRDRSPLVSPHGKSNARRAGREGRAFNSTLPNGLLGISHKLGLTPSGAAKLGFTLLLGKLRALAC